ncbi:MAG: type VI secretion system contractile sheath large subunit [Francisellaceae bacterium]
MSEVAINTIDEAVTEVSCNDLLLAAGFSEMKQYEVIPQENLNQGVTSASYESRLLTALSILINNMGEGDHHIDKNLIRKVLNRIDEILGYQVAVVMSDPKFRRLEQNWRSVHEIAKSMDFKTTKLAIMDVDKEELAEDFDASSVDVSGGDFFHKVYVEEYDQYGGEPYSAIIGLYDFDKTDEDIAWLSVMGKVAEASHAPFIGAVAPRFFGCEHFAEIADIKDIDGLMAHPKYGQWNAFRHTKAAGYIGLTLPNFMLRAPYDPANNPAGKGVLDGFDESLVYESPYEACLWGNAAALFAKNLTRSFEITGWCQSICGPTSGGLVSGLPIYNYNYRDPNDYVLPVNFLIPDHKELSLANAGFIGLVYEKKTANACFFSAQSVKASETFEDPSDSENSQLTTKLPYTFSICKIAHYVKCIGRDEIGSESDDAVISNKLNTWISQFVTSIPNPNTLTRSYYPFKAATIDVSKQAGMAGWYKCQIQILPHIKFEGMEVTLRLETRLG